VHTGELSCGELMFIFVYFVYMQVYERLLEHQEQVKKKKASGKTQNLATVVYQVIYYSVS